MTVTAQNLTSGELKALKDIVDVCGNLGTDRETLEYYLGDLYTWFEAKDVIKTHGYSSASLGGFMSQLEAKGLIQTDEDGNHVTKEGIQVLLSTL